MKVREPLQGSNEKNLGLDFVNLTQTGEPLQGSNEKNMGLDFVNLTQTGGFQYKHKYRKYGQSWVLQVQSSQKPVNLGIRAARVAV